MQAPFTGPVGREAIIARIREHPIEGDPEERRKAFAELILGDGADHDDDDVTIAGQAGTILYLHGGGYSFGSPRTHERILTGLTARTGLQILAPAYPLAPEHRWPAQLDAVMSARTGVSGPLVLAGDSAGGHLALVSALEMARRGDPPDGLVLFSPNTDRTGLSGTRKQNEPYDPMVQDREDAELARRCFGNLPAEHPHVSPVLDDLSLLPPLHVEVGAREVLLGDSLLLARKARKAGVSVTLHIQTDGLHMMQLWEPWWAAATASLNRAATFALNVTGQARAPHRGGTAHVT